MHAPADASQPSPFDRFAASASEFAGHAVFFIACVLLVVLWLPSYFLVGNVNTWQLVINTITTIVTFLLVALLQNTQRRGERALQTKLDAITGGLADLMTRLADGSDAKLREDADELRDVVGLQDRT
jgi:membrane protein implicated in regulation of membrane protease activity